MNRFQREIVEILELLFSNNIAVFETDSFLITISEKEKKIKFSSNWKKEIAQFLNEKTFDSLDIVIVDRVTAKTLTLLELSNKRLKSLYMEILMKLDLNAEYKLSFDKEKILCNVSKVQKEASFTLLN
ncbi:MAG: hypothetical protein ACTSUR_00120 [Candidatus Heimdallarchaeaceae archaeon]